MSKGRAIRSAFLLARGAILIAAVTAICYRAGLNSAGTALVFLIAVVLQSLDCSLLESAIVSVLAVASLDYFFIEPIFSFTVTDPLDIVTLASLLVTSLVITRIQTRSRAEAAEAKRQRENMKRLYNVSCELLGLDPGSGFGPASLRPILMEFELRAVCVFEATTLEYYLAGVSEHGLDTRTRDAYISGRDADDPELQIATRCLWVRGTPGGAIGFEGLRDPQLTAPPLAALVAAHIERCRAFRAATNAAAHAEAEMLRSAILDALAHEIKTPLAAILTAAGGIRATGTMQPQQAELTELIESEASRLADLTSRLLRMARLDREEIKPRLDQVSAVELVERTASRYANLWQDRRISFRAEGEPAEIRADPELILLAFSQLLENACRYSQPDTAILIGISAAGGTLAITVSNEGTPIPASEHARIFDRFYRGTEARNSAPGSGLGLYVARKIAVAHGGDLDLIDAGPDTVVFRLSLPIAANEESVVTGTAQAVDRGR
jgi:two-component system sensor histidine kinase KdpD